MCEPVDRNCITHFNYFFRWFYIRHQSCRAWRRRPVSVSGGSFRGDRTHPIPIRDSDGSRTSDPAEADARGRRLQDGRGTTGRTQVRVERWKTGGWGKKIFLKFKWNTVLAFLVQEQILYQKEIDGEICNIQILRYNKRILLNRMITLSAIVLSGAKEELGCLGILLLCHFTNFLSFRKATLRISTLRWA